MPLNDDEKLNGIENLKTKLFSKNYQTTIEHRGKFVNRDTKNIPDSWEDGDKGPDPLGAPRKLLMKTSIFKNIFIVSLGFFVLTLGYASFVFFRGGNTVSNDNIDISVLGNNFASGGEEMSLVVSIANRNNAPLDLLDLVLEYPKGSSSVSGGDVNSSDPTERSRISIGTIPAGGVHNENVKLTLFGEQGTVRPIKISIEYRVEGSNAIFVKEKPYEVTISSTPINLSVDAPLTISPNQDITLNVKVGANATRPVSNVLLKLDYPVGFSFGSATPAPSIGKNVWNLGDLAPGGEKTVAIVGKMIDVFDGEEKTFQISSGSQSATNKSMIDVVLSSLAHIVTIKKPFVEARLFINGASQSAYASSAKTPINAQIQWTNNLDTTLNDLVIEAKVSGNALDRNTIKATQGFYNSSNDLITWDKSSIEQLKEVNPGDSGSVEFSLSPISLFSASGGILANPSIKIDVSISGKQLVESYAAKDLNNINSSVIHIISDVGFTAKALYYSGAFTNHGPIPPKVEQETTYTIVWSLSNTANNISNGVIHSSLPAWMAFVGPFSPQDEDLVYNPSTKEITWNIGGIPKGTGITSGERSVSFQVSLNPSLSQVGDSPVIINNATLTGHDDFANLDVKVNKTSLTSVLSNDPAFPPSGGAVSQ
jgi:hypothetical protein